MALIETLENNLLPLVLLEGEENEGLNIYERMEFYHVAAMAALALVEEGKSDWMKM